MVKSATGDCVSCSMLDLENDIALGQIARIDGNEFSMRVACSKDGDEQPVENWTRVDASFYQTVGSNDQYSALLSGMEPGNYHCSFEASSDAGNSWYTCASAGNFAYTRSAYSIGDIVTFGHYEQDNDLDNGKEPIQWRVLDKKANGEYLLISEKVLDGKLFDENNYDATWENSTIRSWLNGYIEYTSSSEMDFSSDDFINTAFTVEERSKILESNVSAHMISDSGEKTGSATIDRLFLLSLAEADQYLWPWNWGERRAEGTPYAINKIDNSWCEPGYDGADHCYADWWLRTIEGISWDTYFDPMGTIAINTSGGSDSRLGYLEYVGVRPAMWVKFGDSSDIPCETASDCSANEGYTARCVNNKCETIRESESCTVNSCSSTEYVKCVDNKKQKPVYKPNDGAFICDIDEGWKAVECTEASHCADKENAYKACSTDHTCAYSCMEGFHEGNANVCEADDTKNCGRIGVTCGNKEVCKNAVCTPADVGDVITFGNYEQDGDSTNGKDPIEWRILDKNDAGQYLVISKKVLFREWFNYSEHTINVSWGMSTLRSRLNGYGASENAYGVNYRDWSFISDAFTAEEQSKIVSKGDKIFLLSLEEAQKYFIDDNDRRAEATNISKISCSSEKCYLDWWLRTTVDNGCHNPDTGVTLSCTIYYVSTGGTFSSNFANGGGASTRRQGVRPAMWIDLNP